MLSARGRSSARALDCIAPVVFVLFLAAELTCLAAGSEESSAAPGFTSSGARSPYDWACVSLDYTRQERVANLRVTCERLHALARQAQGDDVVQNVFEVNLKFRDLGQVSAPPAKAVESIRELRANFSGYYVEHYFPFYDILFIDAAGEVFHTVRGESDLHENLLGAAGDAGPLARCLSERPTKECFVDFHHYAPSDEVAAFFVEPMLCDGNLAGWLALQCNIRKLNTILAGAEDLGRTGETFLVNKEGFMLTESNFEGESTVLRKRLSDENIQPKFRDKQGRRVVTDYRGQTALTSFEVFPFIGVEWLVVAKKDKAEVTTDHFSQHERYYTDAIIEAMTNRKRPPSRSIEPPRAGAFTRVDMDEFVRTSPGHMLQTYGVSTCTGLLAVYPGRFAYLAHISVKDRVHGGSETNLVAQMIRKIKTFDIRPHEMGKVQFLFVAPHFESLPQVLDKLVAEGFLLSQVHLLYHADARSAVISAGDSLEGTRVEWKMREDAAPPCVLRGGDALNAGALVEEAIQGDGEGGDAGPSPLQGP